MLCDCGIVHTETDSSLNPQPVQMKCQGNSAFRLLECDALSHCHRGRFLSEPAKPTLEPISRYAPGKMLMCVYTAYTCPHTYSAEQSEAVGEEEGGAKSKEEGGEVTETGDTTLDTTLDESEESARYTCMHMLLHYHDQPLQAKILLRAHSSDTR